MIKIELIEIFREYRNGNKDIFDTLYTDNISKKGLDYYENDLIINDKGLYYCIYSWYEQYRIPYKFKKDDKTPKYCEQVYNGTLEDVKEDVLLVLYQLFNDKNFNPKSNSEIYARLKYEALKVIGTNIETSAYAISDTILNDNQEEYSLFDKCSMDNRFDIEVNYNYTGIVADVIKILPYIKKLLHRGADTQQQVIDLIYKYYKYVYNEKSDICELPKQKQMIEYFFIEYGKNITQPRYAHILNSIFKTMTDCTSLTGKQIERKQFIKSRDRISFIRNYNTEHEDRLIAIANEMIDYVPQNIETDKFYNFISKNIVMEICYKNKSVIYGINHKDRLYSDEYMELIQAIGFMIRDHFRVKLEYCCEQVMERYKNYKIISEYSLIDIAMGKHSSVLKWHIKSSKNKAELIRFKEKSNGELIACRSIKNDMFRTIDITDNPIIQIGRMKCIVSEKDMKIFALSVDDELISIKKNVDNEFKVCKKVS